MSDSMEGRIRQALGDPGSIVGRRLSPSWGESNSGYAENEERIIDWQARAVLAVLGPASEERSRIEFQRGWREGARWRNAVHDEEQARRERHTDADLRGGR